MAHRTFGNFIDMIAATTQFCCMTALAGIGLIIIFVTFFTPFWYVAVLYLLWIWIIDIETAEKGGRTVNWVRGLKLFEYARNYYPVTLKAVPEFKLDPKTNYMFGCFPHGIMANGMSIALSTKACGVDDLIPNHTIHPLTLASNFKIPFYRDYLLSIGLCSVDQKSINWLLSHPEGGKIAAIVVGGAAEAAYAIPGVYTIVLKNRKGFIKLALKNGSPIVPVFSFGEVDVFKSLETTGNDLLRRYQEWYKRKTRIFPQLYIGRGYYQKSVGFVPYKKPITVVLGKPIEVKKTANPSAQEIDALHQTFMTSITELFEKYKYKYIENPETTKLTIV